MFTPVRLTITVYRADRNRFVLNVGSVPIQSEIIYGTGAGSAVYRRPPADSAGPPSPDAPDNTPH